MLMLFVAVTALLYRQRIVTLRGVLSAAVGFMALFFLVAVLLGKGTSGGGVLRQVIWNAQIYLLSSVACLDNYIQTGLQEIPGGALLPNSVRGLLHGFGVNIPLEAAADAICQRSHDLQHYQHCSPCITMGRCSVCLPDFGIGLFHRLLYKWNLSGDCGSGISTRSLFTRYVCRFLRIRISPRRASGFCCGFHPCCIGSASAFRVPDKRAMWTAN